MLLARADVEEVLRGVEWSTLFFFVGLFMLVEAVVHVGIVDAVADALVTVTAGDPTVTTLGLAWLSGIASAIIDNIPYTATMIPVVEEIGASGIPIEPLWWARRSAPAWEAMPRSSARQPTSWSRMSRPETTDPSRSSHSSGTGDRPFVSLVIASVYLYVRYLG